MTDRYRRVTDRCLVTLKERRSKFIALAVSTTTQEEALALVAQVSREHNSATHNCWAFRTGFPETMSHCNDDGEPSGTAGRPILGEIVKRDVSDVTVVVTRYFGGVKLGTRGLIDAYGTAAALALDGCQYQVCQVVRRLTLTTSYEALQPLQGALRRLGFGDGLKPSFGQSVVLELAVPLSRIEELTRWSESYDVSQWLLEAPLWQNGTETIAIAP